MCTCKAVGNSVCENKYFIPNALCHIWTLLQRLGEIDPLLYNIFLAVEFNLTEVLSNERNNLICLDFRVKLHQGLTKYEFMQVHPNI